VLTACTEAEKVSQNVSQEADNFNVMRRLTVINSRTDKVQYEMIGLFSIKVDDADNQLEVIVEVAEGQYKKHFFHLNEWTTYGIEDISGANVSKYHYEINILPQAVVPITFTSKD
jgi:hypothetical protein